jgi:hypothetical protein
MTPRSRRPLRSRRAVVRLWRLWTSAFRAMASSTAVRLSRTSTTASPTCGCRPRRAEVVRRRAGCQPATTGWIRLAGCWTDMVSDPGFRIAVYNPANDRWRMRRGFGPYVNPIAGVVDGAGHGLWYSERCTVTGGGLRHRPPDHRVRYRRPAPAGQGARQRLSDGAGFGTDGGLRGRGERNCFPQSARAPCRSWLHGRAQATPGRARQRCRSPGSA